MIELTKGNLLEAPAEALVNTVNTAGIMGKGVAGPWPDLRKRLRFRVTSIVRQFRLQLPWRDLPGPVWGKHPIALVRVCELAYGHEPVAPGRRGVRRTMAKASGEVEPNRN
jgi:hypothetical protein